MTTDLTQPDTPSAGSTPGCPGCVVLLNELDYAADIIAGLVAQLHAIRRPAASASCLLCAERWRALADRGEDACPDPETHCAAGECECVCHDLPTQPTTTPDQDKAV